MIKQLRLLLAALLLLGYVGPSHQDCWTQWYNRDTPSATGDWETLADLRKENPGKLCPHPSAVQAVTIFIGIPAEQTGQTFYLYSPSKGFVCRNQDQPSGNCFNYKVRFKCPCFGIP
ncbi:cartilage intermediate layer protein 2-like [Kryptolebias marmoratus]|uniref:cartilage intermediate layer protein 2-like n=1 Tax=Kryptolebias marmoratus TaxID=37003 RepID=UPI0007F90467|nr:cartilage intermediate layer protein 2-like [Kryptolebias marmoratus]